MADKIKRRVRRVLRFANVDADCRPRPREGRQAASNRPTDRPNQRRWLFLLGPKEYLNVNVTVNDATERNYDFEGRPAG